MLAQVGQHLIGLALQEIAQLADDETIILFGNGPDARPGAAFDVVVEAGPFVLAGDLALAIEVGKHSPQQVEGLVHRVRRGVRPVIACAVVAHPPRDGDTREIVLPGDLDVGIAFVVLEPHVEARAVLFDEGAFQHQCLQLGAGDDELNVGHALGQLLRLGPCLRRLVKVRTYTVAQVDRLADVNHRAVFVFHQVDARFGRYGIEEVFQVRPFHVPIIAQDGYRCQTRGSSCQQFSF